MKSLLSSLTFCLSLAALSACSESGPEVPSSAGGSAGTAPSAQEGGVDASAGQQTNSSATLVYRSQVKPVTSVTEAQPGVFIPPFEDCRAPIAGDVAKSPEGKVCTHVAISACTEEGKYFPSYASCEVVRRQRPYWPAPPARPSRADDPRLADPTFLAESTWASTQIAASGCTCCHDQRVVPASQWDISLGPLWIDSLSDTGLALFAGLADSTVLGAYPAQENHGFDRAIVGVPSTDPARMKAFAMAELARRGLTEAWARAVPPFGGPIYTNSVKKPEPCQAGQGIDPDGSVRWTGGNARYLYVLRPGSKNPGVPPNLDLPDGTLWRLDLRASEKALESGARFGETPAGSFQTFPPDRPATPLTPGESYQLVALLDVGVPITNCLFEFGKAVAPASGTGVTQPISDAGSSYPVADASASDAGMADAGEAGATMMCNLPGADAKGFGAPCNDTAKHTDCPCAANYCSKSPFDTQGYCSLTGCKENPSICPAGWSCFDVSVFAAGQPSVCMRP